VAKIGNITFACADPAALCAFWAAALDYEVEEAPPGLLESLAEAGEDLNGAAAAIDPKGHGPRLWFEKKEKTATTSIPIHLDIDDPDPDGLVERLLELGGSVVEVRTHTIGEYTAVWTVMNDPEGNGFCVQGAGEQD